MIRPALHRFLAVVACALAFAAPAQAATSTVGLAFDADDNPATGCSLATAEGSLAGIDLLVVARIVTTTTDARVDAVERRRCVGGAFDAPVSIGGGWPVGLGGGVVELSVPRSLTPGRGTARVVAFGDDGAGGQDVAPAFTILLDDAGGGAVPVPLAPALAWLIAALVALAAAGVARRDPRRMRPLVVAFLAVGAGLALAASIVRDGTTGDWAGIPPAATDPAGDAPPNADLLRVYAQSDATDVHFRIDADIRTEPPANAAPTVNAGPAQAVTLPASAALAGSASDDGLPKPPGSLTLAWSKFSGPGTVTFGDAALASTTASFGAAGSYVLRLTAFDGALSAHADVTITVNAGGGANAAPTVVAGPPQSIALPAAATMAGSASDDGLPNPPAALSVAWTLDAGPPGGLASFADPASPTSAVTFNAPGSYVLRLTANDGALASSATTTITVADGPPALAAIADRTIRLGERLQVLLEGKDGNANDPLAFALDVAPAGAALRPAPLVDWVPTAAQLGTHPFVARVTDGAGQSATSAFNVTVVHDNRAPVLHPQPNQVVAVGTPFARKLAASDPDEGDTLTFALDSGPAGMTLTGADLAWPTTGRAPGDYPVTVRVTDAAGLFDTKSFTVTLQASASPVAVEDRYSVRVGETLAVAAAGVLANDLNPSGATMAAVKKTDPALGTLSAFGADGAFSFVAPAAVTPPAFGVAEAWRNDAGGQVVNSYPVVGDVDGDGDVDLVLSSQFVGQRAVDGRTGATLWNVDTTGYTDCAWGFPTTFAPVLADIDDDGTLEYVGQFASCERDSNILAAGYAPPDRIFAIDAATGRVKWLSERVSRALGDVLAPGSPPSTEDRFQHVYAGAQYANMHVARLAPGEAPTILFRQTLRRDAGYYTPVTGPARSAGCRAVTGRAEDQGQACRLTILMRNDGAIAEILEAPNPTNMSQGSWDPFRELPAFTVDVDGDGAPEIVSGSDVWKKAGGAWTLLWQAEYEPIQALAADLDGDGKPEIVHVHALDKTGAGEGTRAAYGGDLYKFNGLLILDGATGAEKRRIRLPVYWTAPLTVADVDGDGAPEFVWNTQGRVYAVGTDGRIRWTYVFVPGQIGMDPSAYSGVGNVQVYDLDGDGVPEVIANSHSEVVILDGRTGLARASHPSAGRHGGYTTAHGVQVVDADDDGHADILATNVSGPDRLSYLLLRGAPNDWLPGPRTHGQVNFMPGDFSGNGHVEFNATAPSNFRNPAQLGTIGDPRTRGTTSFTYAIDHGAGESAPATVTIAIEPANRPPVITSTAPTGLLQRFNPTPPGGLYTHYYQVTATDPDPGDTLTYSLASAPAWVTMDASGRIRFEPTCGSYGNPCPWGWTFVIVRVTDALGAFAEQAFMVNLDVYGATVPDVVGDALPAASSTITAAGLSPQVRNEIADASPAGTVLAQDPLPAAANVAPGATVWLDVSTGPQPVAVPFLVGKPLVAANLLLGPLGLTSSVSTVFSSTIPPGEVMAQSPAFGTIVHPATAPPVELTVSAGAPLPLPVASLVVEPGPGPLARLAGETQQFKATAILTDGTSADVTLTAAWSSTASAVASVDATGLAKAKTAGSATITAALAGKSASTTIAVSSLVPGDSTGPVAAIAAPADGASVTGPVDVTGTATDANFLRYELAFALAGEDAWTVIGEGTAPVAGGVLGRFDPTVLVNDLYTLRLRVFDRGENVTEATSTVQVEGQRKVGAFTLAYVDLDLPAAGIPLTVMRTYDSRDKVTGDFGVGWRLGLETIRIRTNRVPGTGWNRVVAGPVVSLVPTAEHRVSLTLPDGRVEQFDLALAPMSNIGSLDFTRVTGYQPRPGTLGTLEALANPDLLIVSGGAEVELVDDTTLATYEPQLYRYTMADGTRIEIGPSVGVTRVTDRFGSSVTFGPDGVRHDDGRGIVFTRDAKGRIVSIRDLAGQVQSYAYDGNGDLVAHTNAVGGTSTFGYDRRHNLIRVRDASGVTGMRSEFDDAGRLVAVVDALGRRIAFAHDDAARATTTTDRRGAQTVTRYDALGYVSAIEQVVTVDGTPVVATTSMIHDAQGNVTSLVGPDGQRFAATYQGVVALTETTDPGGLGLTTTYAYNARKDPIAVSDPAGRAYTFGYDASGALNAYTVPGVGSGTSVSDARGNPIEIRDALGNLTRMTRDGAGNVLREERFEGGTTLLRRLEHAHDANGRRTATTLWRTVDGSLVPLATRYTLDAAGRVVATTDPLGGVTRTEYDAEGRVLATVDALGRRTTYTYDALGRPDGTVFPDGTRESLTRDAAGNVSTETDRAGRVTSHAYDELNRRVATTLPDGAVVRKVLSAGGRTIATVDARGHRTDIEHDAAGRPVRARLPAVQDGVAGPPVRPVVAIERNALGTPVRVVDPLGRATAFAYDGEGRGIRTDFADGTSIARTYDTLSRLASVTDEEGRSTSFQYDGLGRIVRVTGAFGDATYAYDEAGNRVAQTDALGRVTRMRYDALDRMVERTYPGGGRESWAYDAVGNVVAYTDRAGRVTTYAYDAMDRVVRKTLPGGATVDIAYTNDGRRAAVTDAHGTTRYGYDARGRLARVEHPGGEVVAIARDADDNLASIASPHATLDYTFDALRRLTGVFAPEGTTRMWHDLAGNRVRVERPNGVVSDASYDARDRVAVLTHRGPGGATLASFANTRSATGRRTRVVEHDGTAEDYGYDAHGRLVSQVRTGASAFSASHVYDAVGNRTRTIRDGVVRDATFDADDRQLSDGAATFTYDTSGNRISRVLGASTTQYLYDVENRLVGVLGDGVQREFAYDHDGELVGVTSPGAVRRFLIDGANPTGYSQVVEELDGNGMLVGRQTFADELLAIVRGPTTAFVLADAHATLRASTGAAGTLTGAVVADAYGSPMAVTGAFDGFYGMNGQRRDDATGLYHLRARTYDPVTGRFMTADRFPGRIERPVTFHRYQYADDDPLNASDPSGNFTVIEQAIVTYINALLDNAQLVTTIGKGCTAYSTADWISDLTIAGQVFVGGMVATALSPGPGGSVFAGKLEVPVFGFENSKAKSGQLKKVALTTWNGAKKGGLKFGLEFASEASDASATLELEASFPPPAVKLSGGAKGKLFEKKYTGCGVPIGKFALELTGKLYGSIGAGAGTSLELAAKFELFSGNLQASFPLATVDNNLGKGQVAVTVLGFQRKFGGH